MGNFTEILGIVMLIFGVLQIILFFKIWGMTNDLKSVARTNDLAELIRNSNLLAKHFCKDEYIKACGYSLESKGISYTNQGNKITFSDGKQGTLLDDKYMYPIRIDNNDELHYNTEEQACAALHEYLTSKNIVQDGLTHTIKHEQK